jgi:hypothetical protein
MAMITLQTSTTNPSLPYSRYLVKKLIGYGLVWDGGTEIIWMEAVEVFFLSIY